MRRMCHQRICQRRAIIAVISDFVSQMAFIIYHKPRDIYSEQYRNISHQYLFCPESLIRIIPIKWKFNIVEKLPVY